MSKHHDESRRAFLIGGATVGAGAVTGLVPDALAQTHGRQHARRAGKEPLLRGPVPGQKDTRHPRGDKAPPPVPPRHGQPPDFGLWLRTLGAAIPTPPGEYKPDFRMPGRGCWGR